jgi:hypothetical protein
MSKGRLTRQELGWLLTQEAQGAAERLRRGVTALTQAPPALGVDSSGVDATLSALDDTMKMLSSLHSRPVGLRGRRGRIDLASLLWEVAPEARVSIEPGSGTEVVGDEAELRRMLHVMLGHGSGSGSAITIKRAADEVVVGVLLGPDSSATAETERAWLSRMAVRYGGRHELDGSMEVLALPADGAEARDDVEKLRRELDEARRQGEAYARELAQAWAAGEESTPVASSYPPSASTAVERHRALARFSGGIAATLRAMLSPVGRGLADLRAPPAPRRSSPDLENLLRNDFDERLEGLRRRLLAVQDFIAELAAVGESDPHEPARELDLGDVVRAEVRALEPRFTRSGVVLRVQSASETPASERGEHAKARAGGREAEQAERRAPVRVAPRAAAVIVRELVAHAILATPRDSAVVVTILPPEPRGGLGSRLFVDDGGTIVPAAARRALLALEVEPGTFGRPSSVGLFVAAEIAAAQGALLEIGDAPGPVHSGDPRRDGSREEPPVGAGAEGEPGVGVRVSVTFPR